MFPGLAKTVGCIYDDQENHPGEPEGFCMGEYHGAFQEHGEPPSLSQAEPPLASPGIRPGGECGGRADQTGGHQDPEAWVLLSLHVSDDVTGDREETRAKGDDQLVHVPPLSGMDQFAAGSRFECLFPCLFLASRFEAAVSVFSVEIEFLSLYNFGHEPGIHLDARFNCLLITARPEIAALVGYFYWLPVRK
jgi:hypothetical protein